MPGRQGHHGRVPGPPPGHAGRGQHGDDPDGGDQGGVDIEVAEDAGVGDSLAGHQAGRDAGNEPHQDRILEKGIRCEKRKGPVAQAPVAEQLREVRIAGRVELRRRLPAVHPAVVLDGDGSEGGEHGQDDQHAFHREEAGRDHPRGRPLAQGPADELGEVPQEPVAAARHHQARELSIGRRLCLLHGLELTGGSPARGSAHAAHLLMHEHVDVLPFLVQQLAVELWLLGHSGSGAGKAGIAAGTEVGERSPGVCGA